MTPDTLYTIGEIEHNEDVANILCSMMDGSWQFNVAQISVVSIGQCIDRAKQEGTDQAIKWYYFMSCNRVDEIKDLYRSFIEESIQTKDTNHDS